MMGCGETMKLVGRGRVCVRVVLWQGVCGWWCTCVKAISGGEVWHGVTA